MPQNCMRSYAQVVAQGIVGSSASIAAIRMANIFRERPGSSAQRVLYKPLNVLLQVAEEREVCAVGSELRLTAGRPRDSHAVRLLGMMPPRNGTPWTE